MPLTKELIRNALRDAKAKADEAEVYGVIKKELKIDVLNRKLESIDNVTEGGLSLRVIKDGRMGFAYTADIDENAIETLIGQALENSNSSMPDKFIGFPEPKAQSISLSLNDKEITRKSPDEKLKLALEMENAAYSFDKRIVKSEKISYMDSISTTFIANSKGVDLVYEKSVCGAYADVIAEENKLMEGGSWLKYAARLSDLDARYIGEEAAKRAVMMLGAKQEKSGKASVILSPYAASTLVSAASPALSAEYAQKGKSLFKSAIDKRVASIKLNLIDSGILADGVASAPYDDEGVPTKETILIKDGSLRSFLHDSYTAKKGKTSSTANALRSSFMSQPSIQPTNLFVKPGLKTQDEMVGGISRGFLVNNIMGAHTINPVSGDFSIGFSGFLIENGKLSRPVRGMTVAGNLLDVFSHIDEIGSDLIFFPHFGNVGSPSILVYGLSVSGT